MSADVEEKIIEFTIQPDKVQIDRLMELPKAIKIKATISSIIDDNPPEVIVTDPNGKRDSQRANKVDDRRPIVKYVRTFGVTKDSPPGDYNVKLVYTGLPPEERTFNVEWVEIK